MYKICIVKNLCDSLMIFFIVGIVSKGNRIYFGNFIILVVIFFVFGGVIFVMIIIIVVGKLKKRMS